MIENIGKTTEMTVLIDCRKIAGIYFNSSWTTIKVRPYWMTFSCGYRIELPLQENFLHMPL